MADPYKKEFDWFDRPSSRKLLWISLWIICGLSVVAELLVHRHSHFDEGGSDGWFSFYAILGFVGCAVMILAAKGLGYLLKRGEDYYGDFEDELSADIDTDGNAN